MGACVEFVKTEGDYITISAILNGASNWTFCGWISFDSLPTSSRPIMFGHDAASNQAVFLTNATVCILGFASKYIKWTHSFTTGSHWYHIAWTYDGSGNLLTGSAAYVDGQAQSLVNHSNGTGDPGTLPDIDLIAARQSGSADKMTGRLAHVAAYNVDLTAAEVQELMYNPRGIKRGLQGYWPLMGGSTQWVVDHSGNGNNGTNQGTPVASSDGPPVYFPKMAQT